MRSKAKPIILLSTLFVAYLSATTLCSDLYPTTLKRIPLMTDGDPIWEFTTTVANNNFGKQIVKYPYGLDTKNISGTEYSLTTICDAGWSHVAYLKTEWDSNNEKLLVDINSFGRWGEDPGKFIFPTSIIIGSYEGIFDPGQDYIYITDTGNHRIARLRYDLYNNILVWDIEFGDDILTSPRGIIYYNNNTSDRQDDILFVTDYGASKIFEFSYNGQYLGYYGVPGYGYGLLNGPMSICKGPEGTDWDKYFYVTDKSSAKICRYELVSGQLEFRDEMAISTSPRSDLQGIAADNNGFIYVADSRRNRILKFDPWLDLVGIIDELNGGTDFTFNKPKGMNFYDGALTVINEYSEISGFMCFGVQYLDTLMFNEDWGQMGGNALIKLNSDVLIPCGKTLTIGSGTHISILPLIDEFNLGKDPDRIEILVEGTLISNGTQQDSVLIYSDGVPPKKGDWYGIRVTEPCGLVNMNYTSVRYAENALDFYDGTNNTNYIYGYINHSQLEKNATAGIYSFNSILDLRKTRFGDNNLYGLYCGKTKADIFQDGFIGNGSYGIYVDRENYISDSVRIVSSVIDGQSVTQYNGLYLKHPAARVEGCHIRNCDKDAGMLISGYLPKIRLDTLTTKIGVDCSNSASPSLRYCRITPSGMQVGVNARSGSFPDLGLGSSDKGNNSIFPTSMTGGYRVVNSNPLTSVSAKYNWWGTASPTPSMFSGLVTYDPWLFGEPPPPPKVSTREELPRDFFVSNNYPNPFNPSTRINYSLPSAGMLQISIYNILGQQVRSLYDGRVHAGFYQLSWDGTDNQGMQVGSGVYLINFRFNDSIETRKAVLLR